MSDFLIEGMFILSGLGFWLLLVLLMGLTMKRFRAGAGYFLKRAAAVGALTAVLMALLFIVEPDIALPGPGNVAVIAATFFAGLAGAVLVMSVLRLVGHTGRSNTDS